MNSNGNELSEFKKEIENARGGYQISKEEMNQIAAKKIDQEMNQNISLELQKFVGNGIDDESDFGSFDEFKVEELVKLKSKWRTPRRYLDDQLEHGEPIEFHLKIPDTYS